MVPKKRGENRKVKEAAWVDIVQNNDRLTDIARAANRSPSTTHQRLQKLIKAGHVIKHNKRYILAYRKIDPRGPKNRKTFRKIIKRHHHIVVWFAHKMPAKIWKNQYQGKMVREYVGSIDEELYFQFTSTGIQFSTREKVTDNLAVDVAMFHQKCLYVARFLERRYKVRLARPGDMGMKKLYSELAYMMTGWAEHEVDGKQRKLWLYNWRDDGKPRLGFDKSHLADYELTGQTVADDEVESLFFMEKLGSGELREAFGKAEALHAYMPELMHFMDAFAVGMREHMSLIESLQGVAEGLRQAQIRKVTKPSVIDRLFSDDALRARFEALDREGQDKILGIR